MKRLSPLLAVALTAAVAGCSMPSSVDPAASADHPANPGAPATAVPPVSTTLALTDPVILTGNPPVSHEHVGPGTNDPVLGPAEQVPDSATDHSRMGHTGMGEADGNSGGEPTARPSDVPLGGLRESGHEHGATPDSGSTRPSTQPAALYVCPMHPEVTASQPDQRCSICGMKLVKKNP